MSFIKQRLAKGEVLEFQTGFHWINLIYAMGYLAIFSGLGLFVHDMMSSIAVLSPYLGDLFLAQFRGVLPMPPISLGVFIALPGVIIFFVKASNFVGSEVAITNSRLIYKKGLIWVAVDEIDLEEILSETVDQGIFGQFLNYGRLVIDSRFVRDIRIPPVAEPYKLINQMHECQAKRDKVTVL